MSTDGTNVYGVTRADVQYLEAGMHVEVTFKWGVESGVLMAIDDTWGRNLGLDERGPRVRLPGGDPGVHVHGVVVVREQVS